VTFGDSAVSAAAKLLQSFAIPFERHRAVFVNQRQRAAAEPEDEKGIAESTGDGGSMWRLSRAVLRAHEDKNFQGAMIASLSTPWGETKTDDDAGGYHLVWTRDLVQSASALLATGQLGTPMRALMWLSCIQLSSSCNNFARYVIDYAHGIHSRTTFKAGYGWMAKVIDFLAVFGQWVGLPKHVLIIGYNNLSKIDPDWVR
jgi:hypothetical protein